MHCCLFYERRRWSSKVLTGQGMEEELNDFGNDSFDISFHIPIKHENAGDDFSAVSVAKSPLPVRARNFPSGLVHQITPRPFPSPVARTHRLHITALIWSSSLTTGCTFLGFTRLSVLVARRSLNTFTKRFFTRHHRRASASAPFSIVSESGETERAKTCPPPTTSFMRTRFAATIRII